MRKVDSCYEQIKKRESLLNWKTKKTSHFDQKRRGFKSNTSFGSKSHNFSKNNYQRTDFKNKAPQNTTTPKGRDIVARNIAPLVDKSCSSCLNGSYLEQMSNKGWKTSPRSFIHME